MMILRTTLLNLWLVAAGFGICALSDMRWKVFESKTQHFRVHYPASWNQLEGLAGTVNTDILDIINFPNSERVEGVVIKASGAEIQVSGPPPNVRTIDDWIRGDLSSDAAIDEGLISIPKPGLHGCTSLKRVTWRSDVSGAGKAYLFNTGYYCTTKTSFYRVLLANWQGDPQQSRLQELALKIALSLRTTEQ